jgi:hypothetical protein
MPHANVIHGTEMRLPTGKALPRGAGSPIGEGDVLRAIVQATVRAQERTASGQQRRGPAAITVPKIKEPRADQRGGRRGSLYAVPV